MIKEKKKEKINKKNINIKKRSSVYELIRKEKYIEQFKSLIADTEKVGKISFTKIKDFLLTKFLTLQIFK